MNDLSNVSQSPKLIAVDLGCGTQKEKGFIGVDIVPADQVDVVADLNQGFPFPDHSVDLVKAHDFIEYLPDRIKTMNELWRICKPGAIVDILVPSTDGRGAFQDPTHVSFWNINSFMYYCQEYPPYLTLCRSHYGFKGEFKIVNIQQIETAPQVFHVHAVLQAIKSETITPLNLKHINLIVFPDWQKGKELIFNELVKVFQAIINHPKSQEICLLIDTQNIDLEEVEFLIADVLMNICYENEIEKEEELLPIINLLEVNYLQEYQGLLPNLNARIFLEYYNNELINNINFETLEELKIEELEAQTFEKVISDKFLIELPKIEANKMELSPVISGNLIVRPTPAQDNPLWRYFCNNQGRLIHKWHHYFDIYHNHFSRFRGKEVKILEIGVFHGGSLQMWKEYFGDQAFIYGVDINPKCQELEEERIKIFIGDQADRNFLKMLKNEIGIVDIIIDDGGHLMDQQINSFEELYPAVSETGIYLVEDLHTSYWQGYGGGYKKAGTFIEYAKNLIDSINAYHSPELTPSYFTKTCTGIHFYDSVLILEKYPNYEYPKDSKTGYPSF